MFVLKKYIMFKILAVMCTLVVIKVIIFDTFINWLLTINLQQPKSTDLNRYAEELFNAKNEIEFEFAINDARAVPNSKTRNVIVTTWRSGSTFLGEIFNEISGNYYHYEPLMDFEIKQIRREDNVERALFQLSNLFDCNYHILPKFVDYARYHDYVFTHNTRLWSACNRDNSTSLCYDLSFLSDFCALHPFQSMKLVRLRLGLIEPLIKKYNLNIFFLIRDPRGVMESRKHRVWCPGNSDCDNATYLCNDMLDDYQSMLHFQDLFPNNFQFIRFEDMAIDPMNYTRKLFKSLRIPFTRRIRFYIDSHSKYNYGGVSSTFRDSKTIPFMWKEKLTALEIKDIENQCTEALKLFNYTKIY